MVARKWYTCQGCGLVLWLEPEDWYAYDYLVCYFCGSPAKWDHNDCTSHFVAPADKLLGPAERQRWYYATGKQIETLAGVDKTLAEMGLRYDGEKLGSARFNMNDDGSKKEA